MAVILSGGWTTSRASSFSQMSDKKEQCMCFRMGEFLYVPLPYCSFQITAWGWPLKMVPAIVPKSFRACAEL